MNTTDLTDMLTLGAITGMRSMAGVAALAASRNSALAPVVAAMAVAEMIADKTPFVGDRIAPLSLVGRAGLGALAGGAIARERDGQLTGGLVGAMAALVTTYVSYHARKRLPLPAAPGGFLEDAVVIAIASSYVARASRRL